MSINEAATSCRDSPSNAYWNNATYRPDQTVGNEGFLSAMLTYAVVGGIASVFNIVCIVTFMTKKELREKYLLFAVLAFANLINTLFMLTAGSIRRHLIYNNQYNQLISSFECLLRYPNPHLQLAGGQLPAVVLLAIDIERLVAVYRPVVYKIHIGYRVRIYTVIFCFAFAAISQSFGYLSSYLNRNNCVTSFCAVLGTYGLRYSNYNSAVVVLFPICALILNIFTYAGAKRLSAHANMKKELNMILITLIITVVDVILIAFPNFIVFSVYNALFSLANPIIAYMYVFFCCNSAINLFVYIFLKRDFRNHLLMSISCGALKSHLKVTNDNTVLQNSKRVAPRSSTSNIPKRSMSSMPNFAFE